MKAATKTTTKLFKNDIILLCALEGLMKISDKAEKDDKKKWAIPSISWLTKYIRMSRATVYRSLKKLIDKEYVVKKTVKHKGYNYVGYWVDTEKIERECQEIINKDKNKSGHSEDYITRKNEHMFIKLKYSYLVLSVD